MSDKQGSSSEQMTRKQRRAAERAERKGAGGTSSSTSSSGSSGGGPARSTLIVGIGAVAIGLVIVAALVLISGGFGGNEANAVSEPDSPAPAEELRQGRTLVAPGAVDPVTVQLFEDPQCPHCQTFTERVEPLLIAEHVIDGTASLTYGDYIVFGDDSITAAIAMRAADELDGAFWDYHHVLYHNAADGAFTESWLADIAEVVGLDRAAFEELLDDQGLFDDVGTEHQQGSEAGVSSTPSVLVDGELLVAPTWEELDAAIESAAASS